MHIAKKKIPINYVWCFLCALYIISYVYFAFLYYISLVLYIHLMQFFCAI